ncbi:hypothetical protein ACQUW5_02620 [Legionella sp. CNM-1927-20]|uniref:hypothetical protein n=1 Tax=Legionella sp. CNM-1927-20 TaxID=3422221 RepID=UPI00403AE29E
MKKIAIFLACGLSAAVYAQQPNASLLCGYKDYFRLSDATHPGIYIVEANTSPEIYMQVISPRSFELRDTPACRSGYAHITVAYDNYNWCILDIKDGPYMNHPVVKATCSGIRYIGTKYDGVGSYSYTIELD